MSYNPLSLSPVEEKPQEGVEISPIYDFSILGGQNFYTGQTGSLSLDADGLIAPAIKFNDNWSLLPSLSTVYNGTRQVIDIVGGGTLFQSQWDNQAELKAVYQPDGSNWRFKPYTSFKYEFLQQSSQEQLGQGLYDYYQWDVGADAEYVYRDPFSVRFGIDYYQVHFPNYTTLESQTATSFQGQSLARELVGNYVLDSQDILLSASADAPILGKLVLVGRADLLYAQYPDQHVVDNSDNLESSLRSDVTPIIGTGIKYPWQIGDGIKALGAFNVDYSYVSSNQNSFDASQTQYIPYFYNYGQLTVSPDFKIFIGPDKNPITCDLSVTWWYDRYPHRPIQDAAGAYLGQDLYTNNWMLETSLNYPMAEHFNLVFNVQYGQGTSNNQFQNFYQYSFTTATYMFGFSYDY
ncbi:MAG: hypothetical protein ACYCPQ_04345 [Elusimicrobiota bacterium]